MTEEGDAFSLEIETDKVSFGESYTIEFVNDEGLDASDITAREPEIRLSGFPLEVSSDAGVTIVEDIRVEYEYDIDDKIYELKELSRNERFSKNFEQVPVQREKKKYIPPMSHPWRLTSFKNQIKQAHTNHVYA